MSGEETKTKEIAETTINNKNNLPEEKRFRNKFENIFYIRVLKQETFEKRAGISIKKS